MCVISTTNLVAGVVLKDDARAWQERALAGLRKV